MSTEAKQEVDHARANAAGWLESIREMVGNLDRDSAAETFADSLSVLSVSTILDENEIEYTESDTDDELREKLRTAIAEETIVADKFEFDEDTARQTIEESVLSVEVRSDWYSPGTSADDDARKPAEFCILLSTGGPALRLIGELDEYGQPTRAWLEYQDWGTPWSHYYVEGISDVLLTFASVFYFGE